MYFELLSELNKSINENKNRDSEDNSNSDKINIIWDYNNNKNSSEKRKINYNEKNEENINNTIAKVIIQVKRINMMILKEIYKINTTPVKIPVN